MSDDLVKAKMNEVVETVSKASGVGANDVAKVLDHLGLEGAVANRLDLKKNRMRISMAQDMQ